MPLAANTPVRLGIGKESVTSKPSKDFRTFQPLERAEQQGREAGSPKAVASEVVNFLVLEIFVNDFILSVRLGRTDFSAKVYSAN